MAFLRDHRARSAAPPNTTAAVAIILIVLALFSSVVLSGAAILRWAANESRADAFDLPMRRATHGAVR